MMATLMAAIIVVIIRDTGTDKPVNLGRFKDSHSYSLLQPSHAHPLVHTSSDPKDDDGWKQSWDDGEIIKIFAYIKEIMVAGTQFRADFNHKLKV
jgi:hypothetical protein